MPTRTHKERPAPAERKTETSDQLPHSEHKSADELKADMDSMLDEIEGVLEENAEEFVSEFIQKGGE